MRPRPVQTWLFNPFHYVAGWAALAVGVACILVAGAIGALSETHFDGVLDFHTGKAAPFWLFLGEGLLDWMAMGILLWPLGRMLSSSRVRALDVFGTQALARWPVIITALLALLPGYRRASQSLPLRFAGAGGAFPDALVDWLAFGAALAGGLIMLVWMVALMYRAYAVSCNLSGGRAAGSFVVAVIFGEVLSKLAIFLFFLLTPEGATAKTQIFEWITGKTRPVVVNQAMAGTWYAVDLVRDIDDMLPGREDLFLKRLDLGQNGSVAITFKNDSSVARAHTWHDSSIELYANNPSHPGRRTAELTLRSGHLFYPWAPHGEVVGYYVFARKPGQQPPSPSAEVNDMFVGKWRAVDFVHDLDEPSGGAMELFVKSLELGPDGTVVLTVGKDNRIPGLHSWHDSTLELYGRAPKHPERKSAELTLRDGRLIMPWAPNGDTEGYYVFTRAPGERSVPARAPQGAEAPSSGLKTQADAPRGLGAGGGEARVQGRILSEQSRLPIEYSEACCVDGNGAVYDDSTGQHDGAFCIMLPEPGTYRLHCRPLMAPPEARWARACEIVVAPGETKKLDMALPEPVTMSIRLVDDDGRPVAGAPIGPWYLQANGQPFQYGGHKTDGEGRFRFTEFMPGVKSGFGTGCTTGYTQLEDAGVVCERGKTHPERTLVIEALRGRVTGRAVNSGGTPIRKQSFFIRTFYDDGKRAVQLGTTDLQGNFDWAVGRPGQNFTLDLANNGGAHAYRWSSRSLTVGPEENLELGQITFR